MKVYRPRDAKQNSESNTWGENVALIPEYVNYQVIVYEIKTNTKVSVKEDNLITFFRTIGY